MRILKIVLGIVAVVAALFLIVGLFAPSDFHVERYTTMDAPRNAVFAKINDVKTWEEWGPWMVDPTIKIEYGDVTVGEGATYSWTSEEMGNGAFKMVESVPSEKITSELDFGAGDPMNGHWKFEDADGGGTKVSWGMSGKMPYPFNALSLIMGNSEAEQMFDQGLANIKEICEKEAADRTYGGFKIAEIDFPERNYLTIRDNVSMADISQFYANNYPKLVGAIMGGKAEMDGMPSGIYYDWNEETGIIDMAAAVGYKGGDVNDQYAQVRVNGKALAIDYYGNYDGIGAAHEGMDEYLREHNLPKQRLVVEEYATDPGAEPDTSKWLTKVFYLLEE